MTDRRELVEAFKALSVSQAKRKRKEKKRTWKGTLNDPTGRHPSPRLSHFGPPDDGTRDRAGYLVTFQFRKDVCADTEFLEKAPSIYSVLYPQ